MDREVNVKINLEEGGDFSKSIAKAQQSLKEIEKVSRSLGSPHVRRYMDEAFAQFQGTVKADHQRRAILESARNSPAALARDAAIQHIALGTTARTIESRRQFLRTPTGQAVVQHEANVSYQQKQASDEESRIRQLASFRAEFGKLGGNAKYAAERMKEFSLVTTNAFLKVQAGMAGFIAAGSPETFATLTGSAKLLAGEIGHLLIPAAVKLSATMQGAAKWVRELDAGTKGALSTTATWAVGLTTAGYAVGMVARVISGAINGVVAFGSGIARAASAIKAFTFAHPVLTAISAITLAVGAATNGFGLFGRSIEDVVSRSQTANRTLRNLRENQSRITPEDYATNVPARIRREIADAGRQGPAAQRAVIERHIQRAEANGDRNSERMTTEIEAILEGVDRNTSGLQSAWRGRHARRNDAVIAYLRSQGVSEGDIRTRVSEAGRSFSLNPSDHFGALTSEQRRAMASTYSGRTQGQERSIVAEVLRNVLHSGVPGDRPAISTGFQSQQMDGFALHDMVQREAVRDDMQRQTFEQQMRALQELVQRASETSTGIGGIRNTLEQLLNRFSMR